MMEEHHVELTHVEQGIESIRDLSEESRKWKAF